MFYAQLVVGFFKSAGVGDFDVHVDHFAVTKDGDRNAAADFGEFYQADEVDVLVDADAVVFEDDVVHAEVGTFGGGLGLDLRNARAGESGEAEGLGTLLVEVDVELHAEETARNG